MRKVFSVWLVPLAIALAVFTVWQLFVAQPKKVQQVSSPTPELQKAESSVAAPSSEAVIFIERVFGRIERDLPQMKQFPPLASSAQVLQGDLEEIKRLVHEELLESSATEISISFVWNFHPSEVGARIQNPRVVSSQAGVVQVLNERRPDLVGVEGSYEDILSIAAFRAMLLSELRGSAARQGVAFDQRVYDAQIASYVRDFAPHKYLNNNPEVMGFGIEVRSLHHMHLDTAQFMDRRRLNRVKNWHEFRTLLLFARSIVAVARAKRCARLHGAKNVVIPYGDFHEDSVSYLRQHLSLKGQDVWAPGTPRRVPPPR